MPRAVVDIARVLAIACIAERPEMLVLHHFGVGDHRAQRCSQLVRQFGGRRHLPGRRPRGGRGGRRPFVRILDHPHNKQARRRRSPPHATVKLPDAARRPERQCLGRADLAAAGELLEMLQRRHPAVHRHRRSGRHCIEAKGRESRSVGLDDRAQCHIDGEARSRGRAAISILGARAKFCAVIRAGLEVGQCRFHG